MVRSVDLVRVISRPNICFPQVKRIARSMLVKPGLHPSGTVIHIVDVKIVGNYITGACATTTRFAIGILLKYVVLDQAVPAPHQLRTVAHSVVALILVGVVV